MLKAQVEQLIGTRGEGFEAAREAIRGDAIRTPLLPFSSGDGREVRVKAECLQPYGSFKIRAASNLLAGFSADELAAAAWPVRAPATSARASLMRRRGAASR